jgi:hypothetical protein
MTLFGSEKVCRDDPLSPPRGHPNGTAGTRVNVCHPELSRGI